jgi:mycothiol synthase
MTIPFRVRTFLPSDLPGIVQAQQGSAPLHPWSQGELERDLEHLEPHLQHHFLVAESAGRVVGMADYLRPAGSYHFHRFFLHLCVLPECQGRGIGKALYDRALDELAALEPLSVSVQVRESDLRAVRFVGDRGYLELKRDFESILDLASFDFEILQGLEERLFREGLRLGTLRDLDSPAFRHHFHEVFEAVRIDVPRSDPPTPLAFSFFEAQILDDPEVLPEAFVFALEQGEILGFTGGYRGAQPGTMDTWLTAVVKQARQRGLATTLKVRSMRNAQVLGLTQIRTDNDTRNVPMLKINERLGFRRQPALISLRKVFRS